MTTAALNLTNQRTAAPEAKELLVGPAIPGQQLPGGQTITGQPKPPRRFGKKILLSALLTVVVLGGSAVGMNFYHDLSTHETTDDAYVTGHLHQISSRINDTVDQVLVDDNEHVKAGQTLVLLDKRDYQVKVNQALAALDAARKQTDVAKTTVQFADVTAKGQDLSASGGVANAQAAIARAEANVRESNAQITSARADYGAKDAELQRAKIDYIRFGKLAQEGAVSYQQFDTAKRDYLVALQGRESAKAKIDQATANAQDAQESVNTAKAQLTQSEGQVQMAKASQVQTAVDYNRFQAAGAAIEQAQRSLDEAQLNLSYTIITAPTTGRVGKKTVEVGQRVEPGQPLLTIVSDDLWVVANFKETQLGQIQPGESVEMKIDAFPGHKFVGHVDSVAPGSGASFALLPSDNATGNFTKIVQRVPVKVTFDQKDLGSYADRLVPGMSVETSIEIAQKH